LNNPLQDALVAGLIFAAALLYSAVGHGGASGYLAAMALAGVSPSVMRPTALMLNILVSALATYRFLKVGAFSHRLFWPLAAASVPCAFLGGTLELPAHFYRPVVGLVLIYAAVQSYRRAQASVHVEIRPVATWLLIVVGALLGILSGLTGVGGGIFLSPLLILRRWAATKVVSGIAAAFILVNSIAGFAGLAVREVPAGTTLALWGTAAVVGGLLGSEFGSKRLGNPIIQRLLALVLLVAGSKMLAT
jgi:uncharacterized membrane protein YfcA